MERNRLRKLGPAAVLAILACGFGFSFTLGCGGTAASTEPLPFYIEECHSGTYWFLNSFLNPEDRIVLVNIDAHSDATSLPDEGGSLSDRIQSYSWISPMIPETVFRYVWVVPELLDDDARQFYESEVTREMGRGEVMSRMKIFGGGTDDYVVITDLPGLTNSLDSEPTVVSIDLDFFAKRPDAEEDLRAVMALVAELENLKAVTVAVSPVYLPGEEWMFSLMEVMFEESVRYPEWQVQFEPFIDRGHETSRRALMLESQNRPVPELDVCRAPDSLVDIWRSQGKRIRVDVDTEAWEALLHR